MELKLQDNLFDTVYDRRDSDSHKWRNVPPGVPSMWVADMDFMSPEPVVQALKKRMAEEFYGYPLPADDYNEVVLSWFKHKHHYPPDKISMIPVTGIIPALSVILQRYSSPGDGVIIQSPVYYRFEEIIGKQQRTVLKNELFLDEQGEYRMNFDHLAVLKALRPKIFVLCSPHNPVGKIWTYNDLVAVADFCLQHNILLVADEIHCDLVLPGYTFHSMALLPEKYRENLIILNSSTKTFNIAGLRGGHVFVFNDETRKELTPLFDTYGINKINTSFFTATRAGYLYCCDWVNSLNQYLLGNFLFVSSFLQQRLPLLKTFRHMATYLLWIDYRQLNMSEDAFFLILNNEIILSKGSVFGQEGKGFFRMNIACPREILKEALLILEKKLTNIIN